MRSRFCRFRRVGNRPRGQARERWREGAGYAYSSGEIILLSWPPFLNRRTVRAFLDSSHHQNDLPHMRSKEHTSELQSLMRNSYAVFCLKKQNINNNIYTSNQEHSLL